MIFMCAYNQKLITSFPSCTYKSSCRTAASHFQSAAMNDKMNGMMLSGSTNGLLRVFVYVGSAAAGISSIVFIAGRNLIFEQDLWKTENRTKDDIKGGKGDI